MHSPEAIKDPPDRFDPKTITYQPFPGKPIPERTRDQLELGAKHYGFNLQHTPDGYIAYDEFLFSRDFTSSFPRVARVWDERGRISRVDCIAEKVNATDRTGELRGEQSPLYSTIYTYDELGRLVIKAEIVTQNDFSEYEFRSETYNYQSDGGYIETFRFRGYGDVTSETTTSYDANGRAIPAVISTRRSA